jgi:hypothetical protein
LLAYVGARPGGFSCFLSIDLTGCNFLAAMVEPSLWQPQPMSEFTKRIIFRPPPNGYSWEVLNGTKLLRAGNASSHEDADAAADRAIAEIEAEAGPGHCRDLK